MQPNVNVVQSPQVASAQTSIVQSQQTPALSTNEQNETQTPSQESFAVSLSGILYFIYFDKMCMFGTNALWCWTLFWCSYKILVLVFYIDQFYQIINCIHYLNLYCLNIDQYL
jgi:hypothetical protein